MRLHTLRLVGITEAFPNEVCVDFDSLVLRYINTLTY